MGYVARADPKQDCRQVIGRRSDRPVTGGDLVDGLVPAGCGRLILMYSQSTSGPTQPVTGSLSVTAKVRHSEEIQRGGD